MIDYEYVEYCLKGYSKKHSEHHMRRYIKMIKYFEQNPPQDHQIKQNHHIVPKHMGGCDDSYNMVSVSIKSHLLLHKILYQTYKDTSTLCAVMVFGKHEDRNKREGGLEAIKVKSFIETIGKKNYSKIQSVLTKGKSWITNGVNDKRAGGEKLLEFLSNGWWLGRSNKNVNGFIFCFDHLENRNVKIPREVFESDPSRYIVETRVPYWDMTDMTNFPYVVVGTIPKNRYDVLLGTVCGRMKDVVKVDDGRYILKTEFDPTTHKKNYERPKDKPGARFKGVYVTPYGNFKNCWDFEKVTGMSHSRVSELCEKKVNKIITEEWVAKSQSRIFNESHIGKTPKELGWGFIPKEYVTEEMLLSLYSTKAD